MTSTHEDPQKSIIDTLFDAFSALSLYRGLMLKLSEQNQNTKRGMEMIEKSTKSKGDITFEVTESNEKKLKALAMYLQVLDLIVGGEENLSFDGLINSLLDEVTDKRIKGIKSKHGFDDDADVIDILCASETPKDALASITSAEKLSYAKMKRKILEQIPVLDTQKSLFGGEK